MNSSQPAATPKIIDINALSQLNFQDFKISNSEIKKLQKSYSS